MPKKIKVLFFSNHPVLVSEIAGTGNWVVALLSYLEQREDANLELHVAYYDKDARSTTHITQGGIHYIMLPLPYRKTLINRFLIGWGMKKPYKNAQDVYLKLIESLTPDLIQIFGLESPFFRIVGETKVPCLIHIQGLPAPCSYKILNRVSTIDRLLTLSLARIIDGDIPFIDTLKRKQMLKEIASRYGHCKYFLGRTDWDRRCARAFSPQAGYFYCQEIMRDQFWESCWYPQENLEHILLFTTIRMALCKNVDMIYEVASILDRYNPGFRYTWKIAGLNENEFIPKLMNKKGIVSANLVLLGRLNAAELIENMSRSHLFVYPSAIENGCNAIQEAMLVGIPIVATHAGGVSTTIKDQETGILVQEGDPYALAGAILESMDHYDRAIKMAQQAKAVARQRHDPESIVTDLIDIYHKVLIPSKEE